MQPSRGLHDNPIVTLISVTTALLIDGIGVSQLIGNRFDSDLAYLID